ncbi:hypothetical protein Tsubulata_023431 [Turnera subulata]|uniref:Uncharacterized protein n=1 Tax=Turnera subulata TaxID=218843 RepID=A0A9Q0F3G0_9ROSI|nr:hypothetical protein Tsubulata_023431 [Turnera subulata]
MSCLQLHAEMAMQASRALESAAMALPLPTISTAVSSPLTPPPTPGAPTILPFSSLQLQLNNKTTHPRWTPLVLAESHSSTAGKNINPQEVYPATSSVSTRCFSSGFNVHIYVEEDEPEERVVWRFRREVMKARIFQECKQRRCPQTRRRNKKERPTKTMEGYNFEDDNWEPPEPDNPYTNQVKPKCRGGRFST